MMKRKTIMILFTAMLLTQVLVLQPTLSKAVLNGKDTLSIESVEKPIIPSLTIDAPSGTEKIKANIYEDGDCELTNGDGSPRGFYPWGSGSNNANHSYQDEVHSGSYGAYYSSRGTDQFSSSLSRNRYLLYNPEYSYFDEKITLDFWYNAKANPDFTSGGQIYFYLYLDTNAGYRYIYYYLSRQNALPSNTSTYGRYDLRGSLNTWTNVVRNLTEDFEQVFPGLDLSQSYVRHIYFYVSSPINPTGDTILLFDDVSLTNDTSYEYLNTNGDFEAGDSTNWNDYNSGPGSVYVTEDDYTQGQRAMNITSYSPNSNSNSYIYAEKDIMVGWNSMAKGFQAEQPGDLVFTFDWKYSDTPGIGSQKSYFYIYSTNGSFDLSLSFFLGDENDVVSFSNNSDSSYANYYLKADGFGSRDTWNSFQLDFYTMISSLGYSSLTAYYIGYYMECEDIEDSKVQLLVDDFQMITYPAGDPSFEVDYYYDPTDPILMWQTPNIPIYANLTTDAHTGDYAANLTSNSGYTSTYCYRSTFFPVTNNQYTDFWWRLDKLTDIGNPTFANIRLELDNYYLIYYVIGNNSHTYLSNNSNTCYYFADGHDEIGTWHNLFRNLSNDAIAAFGPENYNVTQISLNTYAEVSDEVIAIFDDLHFVRDIEGPIIDDLLQTPVDPAYGQTVEVSVDVVDNILLQWVEVVYQIGVGPWIPTPMNLVTGKYRATIPSADFGVTVNYYFVALDANGLVTELGSVGTPYTYTVDDFTNPVMIVEAPPESQVLNGTIIFNITDAYDLGSGVASFVIILNDTTVHDSLTFPASYSWNTEEFGNQEYTIIFRIEDNAGNIVEEVYVYNVYNPPTGWETFKAFMIKWGPYIGGGAGALLIGILVIVIVVRRKKRIA
jgi:hypothetical protein